MNNLLMYEEKMWKAAASGNSEEFLKLVSENAVMICGGYRCTGKEYSELISDFGISGFEISCFETVCETDRIVQVHYIVRTTADSPENADLSGLFHVTSTWEKKDEGFMLIFNMDSRIIEA